MRKIIRFLVPAIVSLALGLTSFSFQLQPRTTELQKLAASFAEFDADLEILDTPKMASSKFGGHRAAFKILRYKGYSASTESWIPASAIGQLSLSEVENWQMRGAVIRCKLNTKPAPPGTRFMLFARCKNPQLLKQAPPQAQFIESIRSSFMANLSGVTDESAGLVAGLAIGDTSRIPEQLLNEMKSVSLTHLTAVSGANCAIVTGVIFFLLKRKIANRSLVCLLSACGLILYVLIVGPEPSVLRAAVMALAVIFGFSLGRKAAAEVSLALSICILLIADPWLATNFGFALSVAATLGILLLTTGLTEWLSTRMPKWLAISISVALAAQIFCLPILLQIQSGVSSYAIPANVIAEPLIAPITVLAMAACSVAWLIPWLASLITWTASILAQVIVFIAHYLAAAPMQSISWPVGFLGLGMALSLLIGFVLLFRFKNHLQRFLGAALTIGLLASVLGGFGFKLQSQMSWSGKPWQVVACDVGQGDALVIRSAGFTAVLDVGKSDSLIDTCLESLGVSTIDLLVLTHFDLDHVGGIKGALSSRKVRTAILSPFEDQRWAASQVLDHLDQLGVQVIDGEVGMSGSIGEMSWRVLSPHHNAAGSEDSNDASIAMLFSAPNFYLVTLADLGERGQMRLAQEAGTWLGRGLDDRPLILKVAHHGSADQFPEFIEALRPDLALVSVGVGNSYGHPTKRTMNLLELTGARILRTDQSGSIAIWSTKEGLAYSLAGRLD